MVTDFTPVHIHPDALLVLKMEGKPYPIQTQLWFEVDLVITKGFQNLARLNQKLELEGNTLFQ